MSGRKRTRRVRTKAERMEATPGEVFGWADAKRRRWARRTLLRKQGNACALCGDPMTLIAGAHDEATLDHIVPASRGGTDAITNLQLACRRCNERKRNRMQGPEPSDD